jgi:hypothetical protein
MDNRQHSAIISGAPQSDIVWEGDRTTGTCEFAWDEVYANVDKEEPGDRMVSFSDMTAALSLILGWIVSAQNNVNSIASRALSLHYLLSPTESSHKSLESIATLCNMTRAGVSGALVKFRDEVGIPFALGGKSEHSRETYSRAQKASFASGNHSSVRRQDRKTVR